MCPVYGQSCQVIGGDSHSASFTSLSMYSLHLSTALKASSVSASILIVKDIRPVTLNILVSATPVKAQLLVQLMSLDNTARMAADPMRVDENMSEYRLIQRLITMLLLDAIMNSLNLSSTIYMQMSCFLQERIMMQPLEVSPIRDKAGALFND